MCAARARARARRARPLVLSSSRVLYCHQGHRGVCRCAARARARARRAQPPLLVPPGALLGAAALHWTLVSTIDRKGGARGRNKPVRELEQQTCARRARNIKKQVHSNEHFLKTKKRAPPHAPRGASRERQVGCPYARPSSGGFACGSRRLSMAAVRSLRCLGVRKGT